jgi:hypothetical protein
MKISKFLGAFALTAGLALGFTFVASAATIELGDAYKVNGKTVTEDKVDCITEGDSFAVAVKLVPDETGELDNVLGFTVRLVGNQSDITLDEPYATIADDSIFGTKVLNTKETNKPLFYFESTAYEGLQIGDEGTDVGYLYFKAAKPMSVTDANTAINSMLISTVEDFVITDPDGNESTGSLSYAKNNVLLNKTSQFTFSIPKSYALLPESDATEATITAVYALVTDGDDQAVALEDGTETAKNKLSLTNYTEDDDKYTFTFNVLNTQMQTKDGLTITVYATVSGVDEDVVITKLTDKSF